MLLLSRIVANLIVFFGARKKTALRGETYAWASILGVFDKLREVGDFSYLGFTLCLSAI